MAARRRSNRKKSKGRSKYKSAFNIRAATIAYASLALSTNAVLRVSPIQFFTAGYMGGVGANAAMTQPGAITLKEMVENTHLSPQYSTRQSGETSYQGTQTMGGQATIAQTMRNNIMENGIPLIFSQIGLIAADKIAQNLGVYRNFNKTVRAIGMGNLVKA